MNTSSDHRPDRLRVFSAPNSTNAPVNSRTWTMVMIRKAISPYQGDPLNSTAPMPLSTIAPIATAGRLRKASSAAATNTM